ncbi:MAG: cytochrome ubiquinol oxidase subunit I, partial [Dehalococcoidia bacterium]|nr:cytochrome ubiquinol oxidase subunit I [Dehalococcoidia bacterium]
RQPWVVYGFMRTSEGATERDGIQVFFWLFTALYVVISVALVWTLLKWPRGKPGGDVPAAARGREGREAADVA